tara:strand:+ start:7182 stop:8144 length:963 start_codon:yes stop_codon:yes gene_type:complete
MSKLIAIKQKNEKFANIVWQVSNLCNYRCDYCNEGNWSGSHKNLDLNNVISGLEKIYDYYLDHNYKLLKIFFSGGEPTYWKPFIDVIKHAKETKFDYVQIAVNTNFSTRKNWWEKNWELFDDVVASYHPEFANDDHFIENYLFLQDKINYLCARMMMHESYWDKVLAFKKKLQDMATNFRIEYVPIFDELAPSTNPYNYKDKTKEEWLKINNYEEHISTRLLSKHSMSSIELYDNNITKDLNSNRIVAENNNFFQGWKCYLPESIFINVAGNISLGSCGVSNSIGNLYTTFNFPNDEYVICPKNHCHCGTDICITKFKNV